MTSLEEEFQQAIKRSVFPSAALLVAKRETILYRGFFGEASEKTLFDIASLTKPVATASIALLAIKESGFNLNGSISKYLKDFREEDKGKITIRHLLKHTSGLPAWRPYFEEIAREHPEVIGRRESRDLYLSKILQEPLEMPVAYQRNYSDLGFILLGILLEDFLGAALDELFQKRISDPLGMADTFFVAVGSEVKPGRVFAPTEDSVCRKKVICGEVHDDNAYALGGVAGHAGLFSTIDDLHRFLLAWAQAYRGDHPVFSRDLVQEFIGPKVRVKLGWDTPSPEQSQAGRYFSKNSIGHLGYSGCSFWMDLEQEFHIILLTNRVHPSSKNEAIKEFRPHIHDFIYEHLLK